MIENLFLSVGAMKAGTTWLYEQLKDHPRIVGTPEKEVHYFEQVEGRTNPIPYSKRRNRMIQVIANKNASYVANNIERIQWYLNYGGEEVVNDVWYHKLFGRYASDPNTYCADYSNLYAILNDQGWKRVRQNCKHLKVVYTLRDPLSRVWSHYKFHMQFIRKENEILEAGVAGFKDMLSKDWFWEHARYDQVLKNLEANLSREEFRMYFFEDFRIDPQGSMDDLMDFMSLPRFELQNKADQKVNASKELAMPDEFKEVALDRLQPILDALRKSDRIHHSWKTQ